MDLPDRNQRGTLFQLATNGREIPKVSGPLWELLNVVRLMHGREGPFGIRLDGSDELIADQKLADLLVTISPH